MFYRKFEAIVIYDPDEGEYVGTIRGDREIIFKSKDRDEVAKEFHNSVDRYLQVLSRAGRISE